MTMKRLLSIALSAYDYKVRTPAFFGQGLHNIPPSRFIKAPFLFIKFGIFAGFKPGYDEKNFFTTPFSI
jgi:hypothetical protein